MIVLKVLPFIAGIPFVLQLCLWLDCWVVEEPLDSPTVLFWVSIGLVLVATVVEAVLAKRRKRG